MGTQAATRPTHTDRSEPTDSGRSSGRGRPRTSRGPPGTRTPTSAWPSGAPNSPAPQLEAAAKPTPPDRSEPTDSSPYGGRGRPRTTRAPPGTRTPTSAWPPGAPTLQRRSLRQPPGRPAPTGPSPRNQAGLADVGVRVPAAALGYADAHVRTAPGGPQLSSAAARGSHQADRHRQVRTHGLRPV